MVQLSSTVSVLVVTGSLPPIRCGVGSYTKRLLQELETVADDYTIDVLSTVGSDTLASNTPVQLVSDWKLRHIFSLYRLVKSKHTDIVHVQYPAVGYGRSLGINFLGYALRFGTRAKLVITLHEYHQSRWVGRLRNIITVYPYHQIVVSTDIDAHHLQKLHRPTTVIPLGSNLSQGAKAPTLHNVLQRHGITPSQRSLYFFGYPFPSKHLEALIDAMSLLPGYQLILLSNQDLSDDYHKQLQARINDLPNPHSVKWVGYITDDEVLTILEKAPGYFVQPQTVPLTVKSSTALTAAVSGKVVIASAASSGTVQLPYKNQENCYLLPVVTPATIAGAINTLDANPQLVNTIQRGTLALREYFSWSTIIEKHVALYRKILS